MYRLYGYSIFKCPKVGMNLDIRSENHERFWAPDVLVTVIVTTMGLLGRITSQPSFWNLWGKSTPETYGISWCLTCVYMF